MKSNKSPSNYTDYQKFVAERIKEFRKMNPRLSNSEYMTLAAEAWYTQRDKTKSEVAAQSVSVTVSESELELNVEPHSKTECPVNLNEKLCVICLDKQIEIVIIPCRHMVLCSECCVNLKQCPMCRTDFTVNQIIKVFTS